MVFRFTELKYHKRLFPQKTTQLKVEALCWNLLKIPHGLLHQCCVLLITVSYLITILVSYYQFVTACFVSMTPFVLPDLFCINFCWNMWKTIETYYEFKNAKHKSTLYTMGFYELQYKISKWYKPSHWYKTSCYRAHSDPLSDPDWVSMDNSRVGSSNDG